MNFALVGRPSNRQDVVSRDRVGQQRFLVKQRQSQRFVGTELQVLGNRELSPSTHDHAVWIQDGPTAFPVIAANAVFVVVLNPELITSFLQTEFGGN